MKCPVCKDVTLLMTDKNGIEIDYCPECRGVWLDRGELEKLVQAEKGYNEKIYNVQNQNNYHENYDDKKRDYDNDSYKYNSNNNQYPHKKKKSFLEAFDFFD